MSRYSHLQAAPQRYRKATSYATVQSTTLQQVAPLHQGRFRFEIANSIDYFSSSAAYKFQLQQQRPDVTDTLYAPGFHRPLNYLEIL